MVLAGISQVNDGKYILLDCPHYIHDYEYETVKVQSILIAVSSYVLLFMEIPPKKIIT